MSRPCAIVRGASRGIGGAIAIDLARTHSVIATYKGRRDAAESLQSQAGVEIFQCDISSAQSRAGLMEFARAKFSHLDLLVNNAGIAPRERRDVIDATEESFDELIATNLKGPHCLTREAARWMLQTRSGLEGHPGSQAAAACIVFITSVSAST